MYETDREVFGHLPNLTKGFSLRPDVFAAWKQLNVAVKAGMDLRTYTDQFITVFQDDSRALGLEVVEETPRATDEANIKAMYSGMNDDHGDPLVWGYDAEDATIDLSDLA